MSDHHLQYTLQLHTPDSESIDYSGMTSTTSHMSDGKRAQVLVDGPSLPPFLAFYRTHRKTGTQTFSFRAMVT